MGRIWFMDAHHTPSWWVCLTFVCLLTASWPGRLPAQADAEPAGETQSDASTEPAADGPQPFEQQSIEDRVNALADAALVRDEAGQVTSTIYRDGNILWACVAAFLVMFMQAGFAMLEAGFTRAKNAVNILMKNLMDFAFGSITFWLFGFGIMFGTGATSFLAGWFGWSDFFFETNDNEKYAFLIFQTVFAATAATIVSGAMAERTRFAAYCMYSIAITMLVYPVFGHWAWGSLGGGSSGWLENGPFGLPAFADFAGSTVVHSVGGWAGMAGAMVLGPRYGKFVDGKILPIPGSNMPLAMLGVFILWLGWFGFNPGSTLVIGGGDLARIAVTTNLAASAGAVSGMFTSWQRFGKPDPSFAMNGTLAGLVAITAGCNAVSPAGAVIIGGVAGSLVVFACTFWEWLGIDDPVGAISVHGVCGAWGTLAVGLFSTTSGLFYGFGLLQLVSQFIGVLAGFLWAFFASLLVFQMIHRQVGLRVSERAEREGLDLYEHGMVAYPQINEVLPTQTTNTKTRMIPAGSSSVP